MSEVPDFIDVTDVQVLGRYVVELTFDNGEVRVLDLEPHPWGEMFEPIVADYRLFQRVRVDPDRGTICWPNDADLSPRMLYAESKLATPA
jgi:hypothetical protein